MNAPRSAGEIIRCAHDGSDEGHDADGGGGLAIAPAQPRLKPPRRFAVILHNDNYTTMEFVIEVLTRIFGRTHPEAMAIMLQVHHQGSGVAGVYARDIAETKAMLANERAKAKGFPFKCTVEPESGAGGGEGGE